MRTPWPSDCWWHPDVVTGPSVIAGMGLFARATISCGVTVVRLGGTPTSTDELREQAGPSGAHAPESRDSATIASRDSVMVDEYLYLVLPGRTGARFPNHSCDPNLWWADDRTLVARREIASGRELTTDYSTHVGEPGYLLRCHCETYRCRGLVSGDDWQVPELQQRYAEHWMPFLQRRINALGPNR